MIDPLDKIFDKLNNDDMLSDISDDDTTNINNDNNDNINTLNNDDVNKIKENILETYNDVKKCCIEIFVGYLILIDTNNILSTKNHNNMIENTSNSIDNNMIENTSNSIDNKNDNDFINNNKYKLQRLNTIYFNNMLDDLNKDDILNIPELIKLLTTKLDHNLECFIKLLRTIMIYILDMDLEWNLSKDIDIIDYNGKILINILNGEVINLYLKYISHICK